MHHGLQVCSGTWLSCSDSIHAGTTLAQQCVVRHRRRWRASCHQFASVGQGGSRQTALPSTAQRRVFPSPDDALNFRQRRCCLAPSSSTLHRDWRHRIRRTPCVSWHSPKGTRLSALDLETIRVGDGVVTQSRYCLAATTVQYLRKESFHSIVRFLVKKAVCIANVRPSVKSK